MTTAQAALSGLVLLLGMMTAIWLASVALRDASLVDRFWGLGFVVVGWFYLGTAGGWTQASWRARLLVVLVTLWGLRLSLHLTRRNWGHGEDHRYQHMRAGHGAKFWWVSLFTVFLLQGGLAWIIAMPLLVALRSAGSDGAVWIGLGVLLWVTGFGFESIGDRQLTRFRSNPANTGKVLDSGLWRYTRHPNYFGDALLWWGYFGFAAAAHGWWTAMGPAVMTFLLMKVSGVALLEKTLEATKPAYREYVRRTSAFVPRPPRR